MAALAGVALALAIPATASALTYCVHTSGTCPPGEIDEGASLQTALTAANGTGVNDQVKVGLGTYAGPFTYPGAGGAVEITGVGPSTILNAPTGNGVTVLNVLNAGSRVENLHIDVPLGNTTNLNTGLGLTGGTADGVSVQIPSSPTGPVAGVNLTGGAFRAGSVLGPMPATDPASSITGIVGGGTLVIEDSTFRVDEAVDIVGGGTLRRLDMQGRVGASFQAETLGGANGNYLIEDSLWRSQPGSAGVFVFGLVSACGFSASIHTTARNLTLQDNEGSGHQVTAVCNAVNKSSTLDVTSTIALGGALALNASTTSGATASTINVGYSDFNPAAISTNGNGAINQGAGNVNMAPGFLGATDFRLASGSPLIDIGDQAGLATGESATDLGGGPRIVRGLVGGCPVGPARRDIGAYEAPQAPTPSCLSTTKKKCKKHKKKHKRSAGAAKKKKCKKHKKKH
jgi:hypothetical protein